MKLYLLLFLSLLLCPSGFGQTKQAAGKSKVEPAATPRRSTASPLEAYLALSRITPTPAERRLSLAVFQALDEADAAYASDHDSAKFLRAVVKTSAMLKSANPSAKAEGLFKDLDSMMLTYSWAGILIRLSSEKENAQLQLMAENEKFLADLRGTCDLLFGQGVVTDMLSPQTATRFYEAAIGMKAGLRSYFHKN